MSKKGEEKSEFEKLLEDSDINIESVLHDKNEGGNISSKEHSNELNEYNQNYIHTNISHQSLHTDNNKGAFSYKKTGVKNSVLKSLKILKYKFKVSETLNLHELSLKEAENELNDFIRHNLQDRSRFLLIIHGKGLHNHNNHAPMKNLVEAIIVESPYIMAAHTASRKYGGQGAVFLILKQ